MNRDPKLGESGNIRPVLLALILALLPAGLAHAQGCQKFAEGQCAELEWSLTTPGAGEIAEIAISPSNPNVMYVGTENNAHAFYKSTDGGKTWKRVEGPFDHAKDVAVSSKDPNKAYVAMSEAIHTTDLTIQPTSRSMFDRPGVRSGPTQTVLSSGRPPGPSAWSFSTIEIFEPDDTVMYAAVRGGGMGPFGNDQPEIFKTVNGGVGWSGVKPNLREVNAIAIHPVDHNVIYVGASDGVYVSRDSGKGVEKLKGSSSVISVELQPGDPEVIYAASPNSVVKSSDGGESWEDITGPLSDIHRVRVSKSHPSVLYASTFNGVFRSDDSGKTWVDKTGNLKAKNLQVVTIHPENPDIAFAGTSSLWSSARAEERYQQGLLAHQGVFKTTDGGNTWSRSDDGIAEDNFEEVATNPGRPGEAWYAGVASRGGLKTNDCGHHWRSAQTPTLHYPMRIKYSLQDPDKIYATSWHTGGPFAASVDGGVGWRTTHEEVFMNSLTSGRSLYSAGSGQNAIHLHGLAVDPKNDNIVYAGSVDDQSNPVGFPLKGAHIFKSTDSGKTWTESDEGFPHEMPTAIHDIVIDPEDTSVLYAATTAHEAAMGIGIYKSADAGKTWRAANNGLGEASVATIIIHPERTGLLIAATEKGLYRSDDGGQSWQQTSKSSSFDVEFVKESPNLVYASTNDGVLKSKDFGSTWYAVNHGLPSGNGQGIGVDPAGNIVYAAVEGKGLYVARLVGVKPAEPVSEFAGGFDAGGFSDSGPPSGIPPGRSLSQMKEICSQHQMPPSCSMAPPGEPQRICELCKDIERNPEKYSETTAAREGPGSASPGGAAATPPPARTPGFEAVMALGALWAAALAWRSSGRRGE